MSEPIQWQSWSWSRRKLWGLVVAKFTEPPIVGRASITVTRDDLIEAGIFGGFDSSGRPLPPTQEQLAERKKP